MTIQDPRVFFAAERTLLAWVRTGIAVIGIGFIVARFGLFLSVMGQPNDAATNVAGATLIGSGFVWIGAILIALASHQHLRFCRTLSTEERPRDYWMGFSVIAALSLAVLGAILGVYLLLNRHG